MLLFYSSNIYQSLLLPIILTSTFFSSEIYRQKLQQCVTDGELSDDNVAALLRLRVMLCIPQQTVEAAHAEICGTIFEKVIQLISPLVSFCRSFFHGLWSFGTAISTVSFRKVSC